MVNEAAALQHLRLIRGRVDQISEDVGDVNHRLSILARGRARTLREYADLYGNQAHQRVALDRINTRIARIERHLGITAR